MAKQSYTTKLVGEMAFETNIGEHKVVVDADPQFGGEEKGPSPKPLLLHALAGCTGMDVVSLLKKMRVEFSDFEIKVDAELTDEPPKYFDKIHLTYVIKANETDRAKVEKAVNYMLSKAAALTYDIDMQSLI